MSLARPLLGPARALVFFDPLLNTDHNLSRRVRPLGFRDLLACSRIHPRRIPRQRVIARRRDVFQAVDVHLAPFAFDGIRLVIGRR